MSSPAALSLAAEACAPQGPLKPWGAGSSEAAATGQVTQTGSGSLATLSERLRPPKSFTDSLAPYPLHAGHRPCIGHGGPGWLSLEGGSRVTAVQALGSAPASHSPGQRTRPTQEALQAQGPGLLGSHAQLCPPAARPWASFPLRSRHLSLGGPLVATVEGTYADPT